MDYSALGWQNNSIGGLWKTGRLDASGLDGLNVFIHITRPYGLVTVFLAGLHIISAWSPGSSTHGVRSGLFCAGSKSNPDLILLIGFRRVSSGAMFVRLTHPV